MTITDSAQTTGSTQNNWWEDFYARVDVFDPKVPEDLLTEDHEFTMGNHPTAVGHDAFRAGVANLQKIVARMSHRFVRVIEDGDHAAVEGVCEYHKHDGAVVAIPVMTAIDRRDGRVAAQRVYIDLSPLVGPAQH